MSDKELLQNAINCAKDFKDFSQVLMAVSLHPEWLTKIPDDRQWSILHQIILSGNVNHLEQLLALQKSNTNFRLLTNTRNGKTISDVASSRQDIPEMKERVEHLVKLDEMLNHARSCRWNECYNLVKENPSFVNEKPAYRRYYLIHHMACANAVEEYKRFKGITDYKFDLHLRADRKKCNVIARDRGNLEFATFIESECPGLLETDDDDDEYYTPSAAATEQTSVINNTMMEQKNIIQDLDQSLMGGSTRQKTRAEVQKELEAAQCAQNTNQEQKASTTSSDEEVIHKKMVLSNLTCPLTFATFIDPVLAADGFTYERSAISKWLEKNDRSPMTNQQLLNKNLNTNRIVEQILHVLRTK